MASFGDVVLYRLSEDDAHLINRRREDFETYLHSGGSATGHVGHVGNGARENDLFPAIVVRVWPDSVNLQVFLDGNDLYWATSASFGDQPGQWTNKPTSEPTPAEK